MGHFIKHILEKMGLYIRIKYSWPASVYRTVFKPAIKKQALKELNFYRSFLHHYSLIFDIGANDGHKVAAFTRIADRVIACEPDPANLAILNTRFGKNKKIIIEPVAISNKIGTEKLLIHQPGSALNTLNPGWKTILENNNNGRWPAEIKFSDKVIEVNTSTLDELINKHGIPNFIKIDVEGYEKMVIAGLSRPIQYISFEVLLPEFMNEAIAIMDMLLKLDKKTHFNYAADEKLMLPDFIPYEQFMFLFAKIDLNHIEIIASGAIGSQ